jgi:hypothetical protein
MTTIINQQDTFANKLHDDTLTNKFIAFSEDDDDSACSSFESEMLFTPPPATPSEDEQKEHEDIDWGN